MIRQLLALFSPPSAFPLQFVEDRKRELSEEES